MFFIFLGTMVLTYLIYTYSPNKKTESGSGSGSGSVENFQNETDSFLQDKVCVTPTVDNPFMNINLTDYQDKPNRVVCDDLLDNKQVQSDIEQKFMKNLYQDTGDIWNKNNSQRQFYTMPNTTIPNKQKDFALWLYNRGPTCKEGNGYQCNANIYHHYQKRLPLVPHEDS